MGTASEEYVGNDYTIPSLLSFIGLWSYSDAGFYKNTCIPPLIQGSFRFGAPGNIENRAF